MLLKRNSQRKENISTKSSQIKNMIAKIEIQLEKELWERKVGGSYTERRTRQMQIIGKRR